MRGRDEREGTGEGGDSQPAQLYGSAHPNLHLSSSDEDSCDDVGCVSVEAANGASHGRADQVLADVEVHQSTHCGLQHLCQGWVGGIGG